MTEFGLNLGGSADRWETLFMPKANLRQVPGGARLQDFECSVWKQRISRRLESFVDEKIVTAQKAAILKEWDAHLYSAHRRQWNAEHANKTKRVAPRQQS
jgi:hypothetical protein